MVDLWAGDGMSGDSLTGTLSTIKGATHLVVALLVQDGALDLDRRVAEYWPEFAAEGKGEVTLRSCWPTDRGSSASMAASRSTSWPTTE